MCLWTRWRTSVERSVGDLSAWRPPGRSPAKERSPVTGDDIEHALRAAESLAAEADLEERQATVTRFWATVGNALLLAVSVLTAGLAIGHVGSGGFRVFAGVAAAILLAAAASCWRWILQAGYRQKSANLRRGLAQEIAGMVREVILDVSQRERWSYIRLEATRLRISAFAPSSAPVRKAT
jgi:hypothetical protein